MEPYQINIGNAVVLPGSTYQVFHLFHKTNPMEAQNIDHLSSCFTSLKYLMRSLNILTFSISKFDNGLEPVSWDTVESLLKQIFNDS